MIKALLVTIAIIMGLWLFMSALGRSLGSKESEQTKKKYENSEPGSIGDLLARNYGDLQDGNIQALLDTSIDRRDAEKILKWFDGIVKTGKYYAIRETEAKPGEPNYAFVINNNSGYDFKDFSCKARVFTSSRELPAVNCVAKDWKSGTEGQMWFYCSSRDIKKMVMEAKDIRYTLDKTAISKTNTTQTYKPKRSNYIQGGWTRHDAFSQILHENPPRSEYHEGDIVVLNVKFNSSGHTYCYRAKDNVYKPGDHVEVTVSGMPKVVTVESVGYYSESEYPFDIVPLNYVNGMAVGELADRYKEIIEEEVGEEEERDKIRREAEEKLNVARANKIKADKQIQEASALQAEAEQMRDAAAAALKETDAAVEKARRDYAKREAAEKEAAKPWKHKRPKTNNEVIKSLRKVQDALDEDEQIYKELSGLEEKMTKVMDKADQVMREDSWESETTLVRKLYDFYLPKTISVLEQYKNIFSSGLPSKNVQQLRADLLSAIETSNEVYNNILISLYERDILELTSEMKALQAMFAREGLLNSDFDIKA